MKAPYRFIELNKEVVYPEWSQKVYHDIPLKDSVSGEIEIKIKAVTPIFIRDSENENEFFNFNGAYYIPGSSVKGMLRNLIEVISFSKLYTQDKTFSYRDLNNPSYKQKMNTNKIYYGWLYKEKDEWKIDSLGKIKKSNRIKYTDREFVNAVGGNNIVNKIRRTKKAYKKYQIVGNRIPQTSRGYIIFTGSTGNKSREFLFEKKNPEKTYVLDKQVIENFKNAYYLDNPTLINENWENFWENRFKRGDKIPVFFQLKNGKIEHFGLSMLYKLPYEHSTKELLLNYQNYKEDELDFAQTLFGDAENIRLKGRVFISHMKAKNIKGFNELNLILATPRPTFYLYYLKHKDNKCVTYDDENAILSGFKVYPHKKNIMSFQNNENQNVVTMLKPLGKGSEFEGKIRFFNINEIELGAILAALTFFNKKGYYHKLGMGKPYGLGSVEIEIKCNYDVEKLIEKFENYVKSKVNINEYEKRKKSLLEFHSFKIKEDELKYLNFPTEYKSLKRKCLTKKGKKSKKNNSKEESMGNIRFKL